MQRAKHGELMMRPTDKIRYHSTERQDFPQMQEKFRAPQAQPGPSSPAAHAVVYFQVSDVSKSSGSSVRCFENVNFASSES